MKETNLELGLMGMPPESARNCIQTLEPIPNGKFQKTVNGKLLFLKSSDYERYKSTIICKDINTPVINNIWVGSLIKVGCIQRLWQEIPVGKTSVRLIRPIVADSIEVMDESAENIPFDLEGDKVTLRQSYDRKIYVCFRPCLTMRVMDFRLETDEWKMNGGWNIELEEV